MLKRCLPAAIFAALCMPAQVAADSVSINVRVIQAGSSTSLPTVLFRSGGVITLPSGNDTVAITIGGMNVGGLNSRGHQPKEVTFNSPDARSDKWLLKEFTGNGNAFGRSFGGSPVDSSVAENFTESDADDSNAVNTRNSGSSATTAAEMAALDRIVSFVGGAGAVGSGASSAAALLLNGVGNGAANPPALGLFGLNGNGSLLAVSDTQAIANPEPASMLLLGTGLAGLAAFRRRRTGGLDRTNS